MRSVRIQWAGYQRTLEQSFEELKGKGSLEEVKLSWEDLPQILQYLAIIDFPELQRHLFSQFPLLRDLARAGDLPLPCMPSTDTYYAYKSADQGICVLFAQVPSYSPYQT